VNPGFCEKQEITRVPPERPSRTTSGRRTAGSYHRYGLAFQNSWLFYCMCFLASTLFAEGIVRVFALARRFDALTSFTGTI